jgi:acyl carrier protein
VAPRNDTEKKLAKIWQQILGVERIGIKDNFFELGGHSLKATNLISKIQKEFDIDIGLREIFRVPTLEGIAQCIKEADKKAYVVIHKAEKKEYYNMSSAQKRLYILDQLEGTGTAYNAVRRLY